MQILLTRQTPTLLMARCSSGRTSTFVNKKHTARGPHSSHQLSAKRIKNGHERRSQHTNPACRTHVVIAVDRLIRSEAMHLDSDGFSIVSAPGPCTEDHALFDRVVTGNLEAEIVAHQRV